MKIEPGTQAYEILRLLCYTQEYPRQSAGLLGTGTNAWTKRIVKQLLDEGSIRLLKHGRDIRSLGIRKKGWQAVYGERVYEKQRMNESSLRRCHRIAETAALMRQAGIQVFPEDKPDWESFMETRTIDKPVYWTSKEIKSTLDVRQNFNSSRFVGFMAGARPYVVYNIGSGRMCWHDASEAHTRALISRMVRAPTDNAILLGQTMENALKILNTATDNARSYLSVETCYPNLYYFPLRLEAAQQLCGMTLPNWRKRLVDSLLTEEEQAARLSSIECDGIQRIQGRLTPVLVACDCNLPQLYRLKMSFILKNIEFMAVYCLPFQKSAYAEFFGKRIMMIPIEHWRCE